MESCSYVGNHHVSILVVHLLLLLLVVAEIAFLSSRASDVCKNFSSTVVLNRAYDEQNGAGTKTLTETNGGPLNL